MKRITVMFVFCALMANSVMPSIGMAQTLDGSLVLPEPGHLVHLTAPMTPAYLKGMVIDPHNPFKFDFIVFRGDNLLAEDQKKEAYTKLIEYFLAALAIPDQDQWVNLSPYEKNRIIPQNFGLTEMGRDLLGQDYILKQLSSSLTYPDSLLGKKFWSRIYAQAKERLGTADIPTSTFNKVWIVPDRAVVYEKGNTVYVLENHLKVMMQEDYLSLTKYQSQPGDMSRFPGTCPQAGCQANKGLNVKAIEGNSRFAKQDVSTLGSQVMRELIIPAIEKEVNTGANFALLRQVFSGMLLATWYKRQLKESILGKLYADRGKIKGIDQDPRANEQIYQKYLKAFKKGVFNMIKEDIDPQTQQVIARKYFSGGTEGYVHTVITDAAMMPSGEIRNARNEDLVSTDLMQPERVDAAMKARILNRAEAFKYLGTFRGDSIKELVPNGQELSAQNINDFTGFLVQREKVDSIIKRGKGYLVALNGETFFVLGAPALRMLEKPQALRWLLEMRKTRPLYIPSLPDSWREKPEEVLQKVTIPISVQEVVEGISKGRMSLVDVGGFGFDIRVAKLSKDKAMQSRILTRGQAFKYLKNFRGRGIKKRVLNWHGLSHENRDDFRDSIMSKEAIYRGIEGEKGYLVELNGEIFFAPGAPFLRILEKPEALGRLLAMEQMEQMEQPHIASLPDGWGKENAEDVLEKVTMRISVEEVVKGISEGTMYLVDVGGFGSDIRVAYADKAMKARILTREEALNYLKHFEGKSFAKLVPNWQKLSSGDPKEVGVVILRQIADTRIRDRIGYLVELGDNKEICFASGAPPTQVSAGSQSKKIVSFRPLEKAEALRWLLKTGQSFIHSLSDGWRERSPAEVLQAPIRRVELEKERVKQELKAGSTVLVEEVGSGRIMLAPNPQGYTVGDMAMKTAVTESPFGGIDMNSANLAMLIKRDGKGNVLATSQQHLENIRIDGLVPVVRQIVSAASLPIFAQGVN